MVWYRVCPLALHTTSLWVSINLELNFNYKHTTQYVRLQAFEKVNLHVSDLCMVSSHIESPLLWKLLSETCHSFDQHN